MIYLLVPQFIHTHKGYYSYREFFKYLTLLKSLGVYERYFWTYLHSTHLFVTVNELQLQNKQNQEDAFFEDTGTEDETKISESLTTVSGESSDFSVTQDGDGSKGPTSL